MTTTAEDVQVAMPHGVIDDRRGTWAMVMFILTEASLFVFLFFTYYYIGANWKGPYPPEPPKLMLALIMLGVLMGSSAVLYAGERIEKAGSTGRAAVPAPLSSTDELYNFQPGTGLEYGAGPLRLFHDFPVHFNGDAGRIELQYA